MTKKVNADKTRFNLLSMTSSFKDFPDWAKKIEELWDKADSNDIRPLVEKMKSKAFKVLQTLEKARKEYVSLSTYNDELTEAIIEKNKTLNMLDERANEISKMVEDRGAHLLYTEEEEKNKIEEINTRQKSIQAKEAKTMSLENELVIKQNELQQAIQDTNLALSSYYRLSEDAQSIFEEERPKILAGVEKFGSVSLAVQNDRTIKSKVAHILYLAKKHEQFSQDIDMAKQVFKDSVDATVIDRAINGTENPVFNKGQYVGDYKIKDNKLLIEAAKAQCPEKYDRKTHAALTPQTQTNNTVNIVSFAGVDETKHGYAKNIGVVKSVDSTGKVERITQEKKMLDFYSEKEGAEIIIPAEEIVDEE